MAREHQRHDAEDAAVFGPVAVDWTFGGRVNTDDWGRPVVDLNAYDATPLFTEVAAQRLRDELDDEAATAAWLRGA